MTFDRCKQRKQQGNLRELRITDNLIDFSSNDYLGLSRSKRLREAIVKEFEQCSQIGSTGSRLLTGNSLYAEILEAKIAEFHGYESGLLFNCGYMANLGLLSTVADENDAVIYDVAIHASTREGIRLNKAKAYPFRHNDMEHLEKRLKTCRPVRNRFICIESIYSTDGSQAYLQTICELTRQYQANLIVDEAHATGLYGPQGRGLIAEQGLEKDVFAHVVTFGKALGVFGAIVLGGESLKQLLLNFANSCIYTTALPFHSLAAIKCSYDLFPQLNEERAYLRKLLQIVQNSYQDASPSYIQAVPISGNERIKSIAEAIRNEGFDVRPLLSPTVRRGHEVLRLCLHAFNQESELQNLINLIGRLLK